VTEAIHQTLLLHPVLGLLLVGLVAWLEYVFPPAPGDSVMLLACFLAGTGSLPKTGTIAACLLGSVLGSFTAYYAGVKLGHSYFFLRSSWARHELERLERGFARFGARLLAVNRFLPGIRGVFLYGAGIGRVPFRDVALYATLSNVLWVMLIAWAGTSLGSSWEDVERIFRRYVWAIGIGTALYVAVSIARARRRRRLNPSSSER
jgi:membrane protein DedA with SNARE-associated domain